MKAATLIAALMLVQPALFAQETAADSVASKLVAMENLWNQASKSKDLKVLDQILDEAFVYVDFDGRLMTKAEVLTDVKASTMDQVVAESMVTHLHGGTAVITGIFRMRGIKDGKPFQKRGRFVDTWVFKNGVWVCVVSQATLLQH